MSTTITATGHKYKKVTYNRAGGVFSVVDNSGAFVATYSSTQSSSESYLEPVFYGFTVSIPSGQKVLNAKLRISAKYLTYHAPIRIVRVEKNVTNIINEDAPEGANETSVLCESYDITGTSYTTYDIPLSELQNGTFCVKIYVPLSRKIVASYLHYDEQIDISGTPSIIYDTEAIPPATPTIVSPLGEVVDKTKSVTFKWLYNSGGGLGQSAFDFSHRLSGGQWATDTHVSSAASQYSPTDIVSWTTGITEWRVRTYNANGLVSSYAYGTFELTGPPSPPSIMSVSNNAIPTITWQAATTEAAVVEAEINSGTTTLWSSGELPGTERVLIPDIILPNGTYIVRIRTGSIYGYWSSWVGRNFTISVSSPTAPGMALSIVRDGIKITSEKADKFVYRAEGDGPFIPIARFGETEWTDLTVKPGIVYTYFLRKYVTGYADSPKRSASVKYKGYRIASLDDLGNMVEFKRNTNSPYGEIARSVQNSVSYNTFVGREYEVKESGILKQESYSIDGYLTNEEFLQLKEMFDKNGLYILRGENVVLYGDFTIDRIENTYFNRGYNIQIRFKRLNHDEEVHFNV